MSLFKGLEPVAGEEATEAMLAHFPSTEKDEPITKQFLRAELAEFRGEMRAQIDHVYHRLVAVIALATAILGAISGFS
jgi:hypothetical protein